MTVCDVTECRFRQLVTAGRRFFVYPENWVRPLGALGGKKRRVLLGINNDARYWEMAMHDLTLWRDIATILATVVATIALVKGTFEYIAQGAQKRAERFFEMRRKFDENDSFVKICSLLDEDDPALKEFPVIEKHSFVGFFEDIALLRNSNLMRGSVAHYMFGYYAIQCSKSKNFWSNLNYDGMYWAAFRDFVEAMTRIQASFAYSPRRFRV